MLYIGPKDYRWLVCLIIFAIVSAQISMFMISDYFLTNSKSSGNYHITYYSMFILSMIALYNYMMCTFADPGVLMRNRESQKL